MNRLKFVLFVIAMLISVFCYAQAKRPHYQPKDGFVPDAATAVAIAQAVWGPIYGCDKIEQEKPFKASMHNG